MPPLVYVVDDEKVIAISLAAILNQSGFQAESFTSSPEALDTAKTATPDILISDVIMPKLNGIEPAISFKAAHPACRILLLSGQATTTDLLEKANSEGHEFIVLAKPIHPSALLAALRQA